MALNPSGPLSLGGSTVGQSINLELGNSATALASINSTQFRTLAGVPSGTISISNFYGKSNTVGRYVLFAGAGYAATYGYNTIQVDSSSNTYVGFYQYPNVWYVKFNSSYGTTYSYISRLGGGSGASVNWYNAGGGSFMDPTSVQYDTSGNMYIIGSTSGTNNWNGGTTVAASYLQINTSGAVGTSLGFMWNEEYYNGYRTYLNYTIPTSFTRRGLNSYSQEVVYIPLQTFQYYITGYTPCPSCPCGCPQPVYVVRAIAAFARLVTSSMSVDFSYWLNNPGGGSRALIGVNQSNNNVFFATTASGNALLSLFNSAGVKQWTYSYSGSWNPGWGEGLGLVDSAGSFYGIAAGQITKLDSSGNYLANTYMSATPTGFTYFYFISAVIDSSDNLYVLYEGPSNVFSNTIQHILVKLNSSLVVQWSRHISGVVSTGSPSSTPELRFPSITIQPGSTDVTLKFQLEGRKPGTSTWYDLIMVYPQSGAFTGTTDILSPITPPEVMKMQVANIATTFSSRSGALTSTLVNISNAGLQGNSINTTNGTASTVAIYKTIQDY